MPIDHTSAHRDCGCLQLETSKQKWQACSQTHRCLAGPQASPVVTAPPPDAVTEPLIPHALDTNLHHYDRKYMADLGSNQYALEETFATPVTEAFQHLKQIGSLYPLSPFTATMERLTANAFDVGTKWREHRRHLFLRDVMECEVVQCNAPFSFSVVTNDGEMLWGFHTSVQSERVFTSRAPKASKGSAYLL